RERGRSHPDDADRAGTARGHRPSGTTTAPRPRKDGEQLTKDAAAYYEVASRRVAGANIVPRIMRALRDALLIGLSLVVIWAVLAAAGIPIPFTTVLIVVGLIVLVSFASGLYAQWRRSRAALDAAEDPRGSGAAGPGGARRRRRVTGPGRTLGPSLSVSRPRPAAPVGAPSEVVMTAPSSPSAPRPSPRGRP